MILLYTPDLLLVTPDLLFRLREYLVSAGNEKNASKKINTNFDNNFENANNTSKDFLEGGEKKAYSKASLDSSTL